MFKVRVNEETCIGCGNCTIICPKVFSLKNNGKAHAKSLTNEKCVLKAEKECPVKSIEVTKV